VAGDGGDGVDGDRRVMSGSTGPVRGRVGVLKYPKKDRVVGLTLF
jgi:hypothetical protein